MEKGGTARSLFRDNVLDKPGIAIVVALEREIRPLVSGWVRRTREHEGRQFQFFESARATAVCGGIGAEAARRACQAAIELYRPAVVISAGLAGALTAALHVGDVVRPAKVVDAGDGSSVSCAGGEHVLVTAPAVAGVEQKRRLAASYAAQLVDMEAAAVAKGALARGVSFNAVKAISDEADFEVPQVEGAVDAQGKFQTGKFLRSMVLRPWMWGQVWRMAKNSALAARALSVELEALIRSAE